MKKRGFTLAEVLITLTVIGIVAAMVLPSLTMSINERVWESQRKALLTRLSQALSQIDDLSGYGSYTTTTNSEGKTIIDDTVSEGFVTNILSKVYKIKNTCDVNHLSDCGIVSSFVNMTGTDKITIPKTIKSLVGIGNAEYAPTAIETKNGESLLIYYYKGCGAGTSDTPSSMYEHACVNIIYDLNGSNGPNTIGKDIGTITAYYKNNPIVVAPMPISSGSIGTAPSYADDNSNAAGLCKSKDKNSRLPDKEELAALVYNNKLYGTSYYKTYWSSSIATPGRNGTAWAHIYETYISSQKAYHVLVPMQRSGTHEVLCIKN